MKSSKKKIKTSDAAATGEKVLVVLAQDEEKYAAAWNELLAHWPEQEPTHEFIQLLQSPVCACKNSCLRSLVDNSMGQATVDDLVGQFYTLDTMKERKGFLDSYASKDESSPYPYIFKDDEDTVFSTIPLCLKATAATFRITRSQQEMHRILICPQQRTELSRQLRLSNLLCSTAKYLRQGPRTGNMGQIITRINWNDLAYADLRKNNTTKALKSIMKRYNLSPWKGSLMYAVKGHEQYDTLLADLKGCHITPSEEQNGLLRLLYRLNPGEKSGNWTNVNRLSLQDTKQPCGRYRVLQGNTLLGTYALHKLMDKLPRVLHLTEEFDQCCLSAIESIEGNQQRKTLTETFTSILKSPRHALQNPHYDFTLDYIARNGTNMYLGFTPLTADGMFLQVWKGKGQGIVMYIPQGELVILPSSTLHAGGFCSRFRTGNTRLHFYFYLNNVAEKHYNTNVYDDKKGHFSSRYLNAEGLDYGGPLSKLFAKKD